MGRFIAIERLCLGAAVLGAAFGGPTADANALCAAAGTLFEAAPFVLFAAIGRSWTVRPRGVLARIAPLVWHAGCGCACGPLPGALALPAVALTAIAFGPLVAGARVAAALAIAWTRRDALRRLRSAPGDPAPGDDPFETLELLGTGAFTAALGVAAFASAAAVLPKPAAFLAGLAIGALSPCATAGVAIASAVVRESPAAAAGVLASAGLVSLALPTRASAAHTILRPARAASVVLGLALALLAVRGPGGLVNPRLLVPIGCGSIAALLSSRTSKSRSSRPLLAPMAMLGAVLVPTVPVPPRADATRLDDAFTGERLTFSGTADRARGGTTLARLVITCCRIDAAIVSVRLDRALDVRDGTWVEARGRLVRDASGQLVLETEHVHAIPRPHDPFLYR